MYVPFRSALVGSLLIGFAGSARAQCPEWTTPFVPAGADGLVTSSAVFDDGSGNALYVGGSFRHVTGVPATGVARWNGSAWSALGAGVGGEVNALHVHDDGSGSALHATATGGSAVLRFRNGSWNALGSGLALSPLEMLTFDDGTGPALYVCGRATLFPNVTVGRIQRWNGSAWTSFGGDFAAPHVQGMSIGSVNELAIHDDGSGPALYAAGNFHQADGTPANGIARWNGTSWVALGTGFVQVTVTELASFDDGGGPALYAAGNFTSAGGTAADQIARWRNGAWSAVGAGFNSSVMALAVHDDGAGAALYAGGTFTSSGGAPVMHVARWSGATWLPLGTGVSSIGRVQTLCSFTSGGVPGLYGGGNFVHAGGVAALSIARWSSGTWSTVGPAGNAPDDWVLALATHDDGGGRALYAGGEFTHVGATDAPHVARWNGSTWSALGAGLDGIVTTLASHDEGGGSALYAGGTFTHSGAIATNRVARWDGGAWSAVGAGLADRVEALLSFDDGAGPALYAGGRFPGGIARWNGSSWTTVGLGFNTAVLTLAVYDDGSGARLCAGGEFTSSGATPLLHMARWSGTSWEPIGGGAGNGAVNVLVAHDDGAGTRLYAGGEFQQLGGVFLPNLGRWNGSAWSAVPGAPAGVVSSLAAFDAGSGAQLYIGAAFRLWRFDGVTCVNAGLGASSYVMAAAAWDSGPGGSADLYVGGFFNSAGGAETHNLARWQGCGHPGSTVCAGDGSAAACPCGNSGAPGHGCANSSAAGGARLESDGWNSLAFDTLALTSNGEGPNATSLFVQGSQQLASVPFGDGLRCAGGSVRRLYTKSASGGIVTAPGASDPSLSARAAQLGDRLDPGETRVYQVYYRDPNPGFCPTPFGSTFNLTNGLRITWSQ